MADNAYKVDWTEEELIQFAKDLYKGKLFTTGHISPEELKSRPNILGSIFMPLVFMSNEEHKKFMAAEPFMLFEYLEKAGPRSINGYPIFTSFQFMTKVQWEKVVEIKAKLEAAEAETLKKVVETD